MKKIIASYILANTILINSVFATESILMDNFAKNTLNQNLKIQKFEYTPIVDDIAKNNLDSNLKIQKAIYQPIDDFMKPNPKNVKFIFYDKNQKFDFEKISNTNIKIKPKHYYTTRKNLAEGKIIEFTLMQDITYNKQTYKKGSTIKARVENVTQNLSQGIPADLVIDNFTLPDNTKLIATMEKKGANRALWIHPLAYTTSMFFGIGLFAYAIRGGHAKLKPNKIYNLSIE